MKHVLDRNVKSTFNTVRLEQFGGASWCLYLTKELGVGKVENMLRFVVRPSRDATPSTEHGLLLNSSVFNLRQSMLKRWVLSSWL